MFTKMFWRSVLERAIKSGAQGAIAATGASKLGVLRDMSTAGQIGETLGLAFAGMFVLSVLTSIASAAMTDGNPSLGSSEVLAQPGAVANPAGGAPIEVEPAPEAPASTTLAGDDLMPVSPPFAEPTATAAMPTLIGQTADATTAADLPATDPTTGEAAAPVAPTPAA